LAFSERLSHNEPELCAPLRDALLEQGDHYMHLADLKVLLGRRPTLNRAVRPARRVGA
jgi:hypothetical protein